jgi:hypothetical protein
VCRKSPLQLPLNLISLGKAVFDRKVTSKRAAIGVGVLHDGESYVCEKSINSNLTFDPRIRVFLRHRLYLYELEQSLFLLLRSIQLYFAVHYLPGQCYVGRIVQWRNSVLTMVS